RNQDRKRNAPREKEQRLRGREGSKQCRLLPGLDEAEYHGDVARNVGAQELDRQRLPAERIGKEPSQQPAVVAGETSEHVERAAKRLDRRARGGRELEIGEHLVV